MSGESNIIEAQDSDETIRLREQNDALEAKLAETEERNRRHRQRYEGAGGQAAFMILGPRLVAASHAWFGKLGREGEPLPREESADLFVAVVRRLAVLGAIGIGLPLIPLLLVLWQFIALRTQIEAQAEDTRIIRRTQFMATIYELSSCDRSRLEVDEDCPPRAPIQLRAEAVRALSQMQGENLNLAGADLRGADLGRTQLSNAGLPEVDLRGASLWQANLRDADLRGADFREALLQGADLRGAKLLGVDLRGVSLDLTQLRGAVLKGADLRGASLRGSGGMSQGQFAETCGDRLTQVPRHLDRPAHWLDRSWEEGDAEDAGCPLERGEPGSLP